MSKYNYIIYHKNCIDGFTGFIILMGTDKIDKNAKIYPDIPAAKNIPHDIENKDVIIIDVAYKYNILKEIMTLAKSVTFIDHHITIKDDVQQIISELNNKNHIVYYDDKMSGASLTWKYFYPKKKIPLFIKYVADNDTGAWVLKHTIPFITALDVNYSFDLTSENIKKWDNLYNKKEVIRLIKKGYIYEEYKNNIIKYNSQRYSLEAFPSEKIYNEHIDLFRHPGQYKVAVFCGTGCPNVTDLAKEMLRTIDCDFVIIWSLNLDKKEFVLSFRSLDVDVGSISKAFGGGGHKLAAACSFSLFKYNIADLFLSQSLPRASKNI